MDLLAELIWAYRHARRPRFRAHVMRAGLPLCEGYTWGLANVAASPDSALYDPDPAGDLALIVGAFQRGELFDLVATSNTFGVRSRLGAAWILGVDALEDAVWGQEPLMLWADAWSWLANGRTGAVILDWDHVGFRLEGVPSIVCETADLMAEVERAFSRPLDMPALHLLRQTPETADAQHA